MATDLLQDILNNLSELIYVSDVDNYELLYMNEEGMKMFDVGDFKGQKCYKVLQGRDEPCEFCTNHLLNLNEYYTWTKTNPITGQTYLLKDKLINWNDKLSRIEIAFSQENQLKKEEAMQDLLNIETVLVKCITELHRTKDIHSRIQEMVEIVGEFLQADRVYVFLIHGDYMDNAYEWCGKHVEPEIKELQNLDVHLIDRWRKYFDNGECMVMDDIEDIKAAGSEYQILKAQNIHNMVVAPLESDNQLIGYIGADNPPKDKVEKLLPFFTTLSYFLSSSIIKHRNEEMLQQMSYYDILTGIYNRNRYMEDIQLIEEQHECNLGVFYIDMNGLKVINDTYGHTYGDVALKQLANILKDNFDKDMLYRLGGDEFVVLYRTYSKELFLEKVHILKDSFERANCSVAIGYEYITEGKDIQAGMKTADEMMYEDKKKFYRHNITKRYRYYNDEFLEFMDKERLMKLLKEHRFSIYLQPKLTIKNRNVQGAEVLIRYSDSNSQIIMPDQFIPILENCGLMYILDFFVLDKTCRVIGDWLKKGYTIYPVSINLSDVTLFHPQFKEYLNHVWNQYHLSKDLVQFEISKGNSDDTLEKKLSVIQLIKQEGFNIIIDDVGANRSNIFLFSSVDFDVMKLDRSLTQKLLNNKDIHSLVSSLIKVCHEMGVSIVAKGVENMEILNALEDMNIDEVQGYLFSGPITLDEYTTKYIEKREKS